MKVKVFETSKDMGVASAKHAAQVLNEIIARGEKPRLLLSVQWMETWQGVSVNIISSVLA